MAVPREETSADASPSYISPNFEGDTKTKNTGREARTPRWNMALNALLGSFWGSRNVCVISGLGPHRSGVDGFSVSFAMTG